MPKTWKEATVYHIKEMTLTNDTNIFTFKEFSETKISAIMIDTQTNTKYPHRTLDKILRDLRDFKILLHRTDIGPRVYEYIPNNDNEELIFKEKRSIGHIRVTKCLDKLKIKYEEEKTFSDLKYKSYLKFDIYFKLFKQKFAIEYDGAQHSKTIDVWGGNKSLLKNKHRDTIKNSYCKKRRIHLLRISHDIKDIELYVITFLYTTLFEHLAKCLCLISLLILKEHPILLNMFTSEMLRISRV